MTRIYQTFVFINFKKEDFSKVDICQVAKFFIKSPLVYFLNHFVLFKFTNEELHKKNPLFDLSITLPLLKYY